MRKPARVNVIGSAISVCDAAGAIAELDNALRCRAGGYVCFTNVHTAVMARADTLFKEIADRALLSVADGKPIYWLGRARVERGSLGHIPGPNFMMQVLRRFPERRHFLYGSSPAVLDLLVPALRNQVPGLNICGVLSPPFRPLTEAEKAAYRQQIRQTEPDFVWVGLGAPKQEQWMADSWESLRPSILLGVGAAFDFHAGTVRRAPEWVQHSGLEWAYRLAKEPRRLWKRYMTTNCLFLVYVIRDWIAGRFRRSPVPEPRR